MSETAWTQSNTVYNFLRNDVSARAAALAGSFVTVANDPNVLFYNPAGIGTLEQASGSVGFFKHLLDINSGYVSYGQEFEGIGHFGVGVMYTNYGSFTETDESDNTLGTFNAADIAASIGYSNTLDENLYYGVALKFIHSSIADAGRPALHGHRYPLSCARYKVEPGCERPKPRKADLRLCYNLRKTSLLTFPSVHPLSHAAFLCC